MDYFDKRDNVSLCGEENDNFSSRFSDIREFYENKNVLITDATGLMGSLLVERLLRSCPEIGTIYLLMKPKKNKLHDEILDELFSEVLIRINKKHQYLRTKIKIVYVDFAQPWCGISEFDQKILTDEIHIVYHFAREANKYESLKSLYSINIQSTEYLLELAIKMKKLKAFIYVSSIRSMKLSSDVEQKFHESVISESDLKSWKENIDEEQLQVVSPKLVGKKMELNDFIKAVADEIVEKYAGKIPIAIARSSNDVYCRKDAMLNGDKLFNVFTDPRSTFINILRLNPHGILKKFISAENVVSTLVAISWGTSTHKSDRKKTSTPVYNIIPSSEIPTSCQDHLNVDTNIIFQAVSKKIQENEKLHRSNHEWMNFLKKYIYPVLFLLMLDLYLQISGNTNKLLNTFVKLDDHNLSSGCYYSLDCANKQSNVDKLWSSMSNIDKKLFNFNSVDYNQEQCNSRYIRNVIVHFFKKDLNDFEMTSKSYTRYLQVKMCMKILLFGISTYFLKRYFLILVTFFNEIFL